MSHFTNFTGYVLFITTSFLASVESKDQCLLNSKVLSCFSGVIMSIRSFFSIYTIEISLCYEDGVKVNLFFKKVYEHKSLVWRCWMSRSSYGIVRVFKQKFFINYIDSLRNFLMRFIRSMKKCSSLDLGLKMIN